MYCTCMCNVCTVRIRSTHRWWSVVRVRYIVLHGTSPRAYRAASLRVLPILVQYEYARRTQDSLNTGSKKAILTLALLYKYPYRTACTTCSILLRLIWRERSSRSTHQLDATSRWCAPLFSRRGRAIQQSSTSTGTVFWDRVRVKYSVLSTGLDSKVAHHSTHYPVLYSYGTRTRKGEGDPCTKIILYSVMVYKYTRYVLIRVQYMYRAPLLVLVLLPVCHIGIHWVQGPVRTYSMMYCDTTDMFFRWEFCSSVPIDTTVQATNIQVLIPYLGPKIMKRTVD